MIKKNTRFIKKQ